jgi:hypothetical protein
VLEPRLGVRNEPSLVAPADVRAHRDRALVLAPAMMFNVRKNGRGAANSTIWQAYGGETTMS